MNEFADLLNSERQQVESSRRAIAAKQALRRESDLESADARVADSMAKESEQKRRSVLESVLSDPSVKNHAAKFSPNSSARASEMPQLTESELSSISRFGDIINAKPETTTEPSLPNEATAEQLVSRSARNCRKRKACSVTRSPRFNSWYRWSGR